MPRRAAFFANARLSGARSACTAAIASACRKRPASLGLAVDETDAERFLGADRLAPRTASPARWRGRRCAAAAACRPAPATVPMRALVMAKLAPSPATLRSQASASSHPPVMQKPSMAAITGLDSASSVPFSRCRLRKYAQALGRALDLERLRKVRAGGEILRPAGEDQRADGRIGARPLAAAAMISPIICRLMALRRSGRLRVMIAAGPSRRTRIDARLIVSSLRTGLRIGLWASVDAPHPSAYFSASEIKFRTAG